MPRLRLVLLLVALTAVVPAGAAPVPKVPTDPTRDRDGNPLPKGATARLGSRPFFDKGLSGLTFSADGKKLRAIAGVERVLAWDADTGKALPALSIKWRPESDGEQAVASTLAGDRAIWVTRPIDRAAPDRVDPKAVSTAYAFRLSDGSEVCRARFTGLANFDVLPHNVWTAAASADGKYLAVAPEPGRAVEVFDMETGKRLHTQKLAGGGDPGVYISPDAKTLYVSEYKLPLRRFELVGGKEVPAVADADGSIHLIAASADGKRLATLEWTDRKDDKGKEVHVASLVLRDAAANETLGRPAGGGYPWDFGFLGSDAVVVLASTSGPGFPPTYTLSRWNATTLRKEWEVPAPDLPDRLQRRLIVGPDGKRFALTDQHNFVHVYDGATGKPVVERSGHDTWVSWVGFSPDGERVTTVGRDGVRTWTPAGERAGAGRLPALAGGRVDPTLFGEHLVWVAPAADGKSAQLVGWDGAKGAIGWRMPVEGDGPDRVLTGDGKTCVGVAWNAAKRLWDVTVYDGLAGLKRHAWTYDKTQNGASRWWPMALAPDGATLFVGGDGVVGLNAATGKETLRIDAGQLKTDDGPAPFPMAVSGDGKRIAVIRGEPRRGPFLRVFEIETGKQLAAHALGDVRLPALRFSPGGKQVAVWNVRGTTVQVCDAESGETPPRQLVGDGARARCAAFSPNGASLAVGYEDGTALIWNLTAK